MIKSKIQFMGNRPMISVDGELRSPVAYTTYFDECGEWSDFINSGHRIFFVNISFTDLPINNTTGFTPFRTGVFEGDMPDYSEFESTVHKILSECPDALIFPRINIAMPRWWINSHPDETVSTPSGARESLFSDLFLRDGERLLREMLKHFRSSDYSHRIAGYQLCGGTTQEWFHHDLFGSYSKMGMDKFRKWASEKHGVENIKAPEKGDFDSGINTEAVTLYYEFCNELISRTVEHFARVTKGFTEGSQVVGVFYGYNGFVSDPLWGTHGLRYIINSPYIDFFSSPCAYDDTRNLGLDWGDMLPVDSIKHHGKLCFIECDIRTHLTRRMQESRPNEYPDDIMSLTLPDGRKSVWCGPDTLELSLSAIRKAFAHQVTKGSGIWWFDMWGGWYHSDVIMSELQALHKTYETLGDTPSSAEVVFFIDESAYSSIPRGNHLLSAVNNVRVALGNTGIPFDTYMVEDAPEILSSYKYAIFSAPFPSMAGKEALALCKKLGIPHIEATEETAYYSTNKLRQILIDAGIHCYNSQSNVIYCGNGILAIHTAHDGETIIHLPRKMKIAPLHGTDILTQETDTIKLTMPKHSTAIFSITDI